MQAADYDHIQQLLASARSLTDAAEAHGTLAGCLCATVDYRFEDWLSEILPSGETSPQARQALWDLYQSTADALQEAQMDFAPLLPEDEQPIDARTTALALWCQGFLYGLGTSAIHDATQLRGDAGEVVRDLTEITHVGVDTRESLESNEGAYAELVEFVRVGVQLVFDELEPLRSPPVPPASAQGSLH